jgi:PHP domain-containing protein
MPRIRRLAAPAMNGPLGIVHVHSTFSHDGRDTLEALHAFARKRGIAFVGLTDHAEDLDRAIFDRFVAECARVSTADVRLIPGLEFRFAGWSGLHLLALGLRQWIEPATPAEFAAVGPNVAGFTIMAHPLLPGYQLPDEVAATLNAIEVWNAAYNTRFLPDPRAIRLLEQVRRRHPQLVGVAGLDQHDSRNDRETRVQLLGEGAVDPLEELRAGRFVNVGRTMRFPPRAPFGVGAMAGLTLLRGGLDAVNGVHERVSRALRSGR